MAARVPVDRASPADLMQLATDVGPAPMHVGTVLVLATGPGFNVAEAQRLLERSIRHQQTRRELDPNNPEALKDLSETYFTCLLYTSPSPRD